MQNIVTLNMYGLFSAEKNCQIYLRKKMQVFKRKFQTEKYQALKTKKDTLKLSKQFVLLFLTYRKESCQNKANYLHYKNYAQGSCLNSVLSHKLSKLCCPLLLWNVLPPSREFQTTFHHKNRLKIISYSSFGDETPSSYIIPHYCLPLRYQVLQVFREAISQKILNKPVKAM